MRFVIALVLTLLLAPVAAARAEEGTPEKDLRPTIAQTVVEATAPAQPTVALTQVKIPRLDAAEANALATQEMPRRGSFWWLVGVIVVAGVILAVVLD